MSIDFKTEIQFLKGVGPKRAETLARLGIETVGDLLFHLPARYEDRRNILPIENLAEGVTATVRGTIATARVIKGRFGKKMFQMTIRDTTGILSCLWFSAKGDYHEKKYHTGLEIIATGRITFSRYAKSFEMPHPDVEIVEGDDNSRNAIIPVYPLTEGLPQNTLRGIVPKTFELIPRIPETIPESVLKKTGLLPRGEAIRQVHTPGQETGIEDLASWRTDAQKRMIFEEFFLLETAMAIQRSKNRDTVVGVEVKSDDKTYRELASELPFQLTDDQTKSIEEIRKDLKGEHPMNRLLQGDVGSGKTIVAAVTMMLAVKDGYQSVIMAPTEILAEQHFKTFKALKCMASFEIELLKASTKEKSDVKERIANGNAKIIIGTHALLQGNVEFNNLGVVVIDEQHRFGVRQRAGLISKGPRPNTLIMTATPIPRTLALTLYSDLDVSVIRNAPKGRGKIDTQVIKPSDISKAHILLHREIKKGRQAYIVYPLVEESDKMELKAATEMYERYRTKVFPDLRIGLVHGRMKADEKNGVMFSFMNGELDILISTTVIEVGIDQPNATVMMIEHSERFGLAQLHQLRGRVGRGADDSHCLLAIEYPISDIARERLKVMTRSTDGFVIAEKDLELRGTGDLLGTRQSGLPTFKVANLIRDFEILQWAKDEAFALVKGDPDLSFPEHKRLKTEIEKNWTERLSLGDVG